MIPFSVCAKIYFDTFTQNLQLLYTIYRKIDSSVWLVDLEMHSYLFYTQGGYIFTIYTSTLIGTPTIIFISLYLVIWSVPRLWRCQQVAQKPLYLPNIYLSVLSFYLVPVNLSNKLHFIELFAYWLVLYFGRSPALQSFLSLELSSFQCYKICI